MTNAAVPTTFAVKDPEETVAASFDFSTLADSVSSPVLEVSRLRGSADASPSAMLFGQPATSGAVVTQLLAGGVDGADYSVRCRVTAGPETLVLAAMLPVRRKA